jgi:hypothetical protein
MGRSWQETAKIAQDVRDESIAQVLPTIPAVPAELPKNVTGIPRTLLSKGEVALTEQNPEELLQALATGAVSSSTVTLAFLRRAGIAQKLASPSQSTKSLLMISRQTVSPNFFPARHWNVRNISMTTWQSMGSRLACSMDCQ